MQRLIASGWVGRAGWERSAASTMAGIGNSLDGGLWSFGRQHFQAPLVPLELATPWFHGNFTASGRRSAIAGHRPEQPPADPAKAPILTRSGETGALSPYGRSPPPEGFHVPPAP